MGLRRAPRSSEPRRCTPSRSAPSRATRARARGSPPATGSRRRPAQLGLPSRYPGREQVLSFRVPTGARNAGVRVLSGAVVPQLLLAPNENRLAGETALDLVENPYLDRYGDRVPVSALLLPRAGRYYVSVETKPGSQPGPLPAARLGERRARRRRSGCVPRTLYGADPELHFVVRDRQSGFDPDSLSVLGRRRQPSHVHVAGGNVTVELGQLAPGVASRAHLGGRLPGAQELRERGRSGRSPNTRVTVATLPRALTGRACNGVAGRASIVLPTPSPIRNLTEWISTSTRARNCSPATASPSPRAAWRSRRPRRVPRPPSSAARSSSRRRC